VPSRASPVVALDRFVVGKTNEGVERSNVRSSPRSRASRA